MFHSLSSRKVKSNTNVDEGISVRVNALEHLYFQRHVVQNSNQFLLKLRALFRNIVKTTAVRHLLFFSFSETQGALARSPLVTDVNL